MTFAIISPPKTARLCTDFGRDLAEKWFPGMVEMLPRYQRGKNKDKLRGCITWRKVEKGGWHGRPVKGGTCIDKELHAREPIGHNSYTVAVYECPEGERFPVPTRTYMHKYYVDGTFN